MENFAAAFETVDFKKTGLINNIQFFVMWRELEKRWRDQGVIARIPIPDRELVKYFEIFEDFNSGYEGVTLEDMIECRAMINKKAKAKRQGASANVEEVDLERI